MIDHRTVQQIIDTAQVQDVIEEYVHLKPRGANLLGLCPFHNEKTPSFTVSPSKNIYKCFGCGRAGNPIQFLMDHESMSFPEALRFLAKKYGIEIKEKEITNEERQEAHKKDSFFIINNFASEYFQKQLFETNEGKSVALSYFKQRGYRENTIKKFQLGYANMAKDDLTKWAVEKGYNIDYMREMGLTSRFDQDFFRSRVMFPIHNLSGKVLGFGGRTLSTDKKTPKYLNSPESEIYNKRNILYGAHLAKKSIRQEDECILVEGYTDVISLHQAGIENVMASSGTSLTENQIRLIKRFTENVKIIFDGDPAGIKAALRGIDLVLEQNMNVQLVLLPEGEDPDSFVQSQGNEGFRAHLKENAKDFIFFKLEILLDEVGSDPVKKTKMLRDIVSSIAKIPDAIKRSLYIKECSRILDVNEQVLIAETNQSIRTDIKQKNLRKQQQQRRESLANTLDQSNPLNVESSQNEQTKPPVALGDEFQEKDLIRLIISLGHKEFADEQSVASYILENISDVIELFDNALYKEIIEIVKNEIDGGNLPQHSFYTNHSREEIRVLAVNMLSTPYTYADWERKNMMLQTQPHPEQNFKRDSHQAILRLKARKLGKSKNEIEERIKNCSPSDDSENYYLLLKAHQKVKEMLSDIYEELRTVIPGK